jgi:hypothetical protein
MQHSGFLSKIYIRLQMVQSADDGNSFSGHIFAMSERQIVERRPFSIKLPDNINGIEHVMAPLILQIKNFYEKFTGQFVF